MLIQQKKFVSVNNFFAKFEVNKNRVVSSFHAVIERAKSPAKAIYFK